MPKVDVAFDVAGPVLTLASPYFDPIVSTGLAGSGGVVMVPAGAPIQFCFSAEPSAGGDPVDAYRYGFDLLDPGDPDAWDVGFTPFDGSELCVPAPAFFFGAHTFHVEVRDAAGASSRIGVTLSIVRGPQQLDVRPKSCDNRFKPRGKGKLTTALPLLLGQDPGDIDLSTVEMTVEGQSIRPVKSRVRDVTSPAAEYCGCNEGKDGVDDLVLKFPVEEITRALGPVTPGERRFVSVGGWLHSGDRFDVSDCIVIAGEPEDEDDDALALRDDVLAALLAAYNDKDFDRVRRLFDDDFAFFFSQQDIDDGRAPAPQWDKASELAATASLFNAEGHGHDRLSDRDGRTPLRRAAVEEATWGSTKAWFFSTAAGDPTQVNLSLAYPRGEDAWAQVIPDPARYPGEVWYEKTVLYLLRVEAGAFTFLNADGIRASFVVRPEPHGGDHDGGDRVAGSEGDDDDDDDGIAWRLVRWRDDI